MIFSFRKIIKVVYLIISILFITLFFDSDKFINNFLHFEITSAYFTLLVAIYAIFSTLGLGLPILFAPKISKQNKEYLNISSQELKYYWVDKLWLRKKQQTNPVKKFLFSTISSQELKYKGIISLIFITVFSYLLVFYPLKLMLGYKLNIKIDLVNIYFFILFFDLGTGLITQFTNSKSFNDFLRQRSR